MSQVKQLKELIAPNAATWGVVLAVDNNTVTVGTNGTVRQFPRTVPTLKKGDRVIIEGEQLRTTTNTKPVIYQV